MAINKLVKYSLNCGVSIERLYRLFTLPEYESIEGLKNFIDSGRANNLYFIERKGRIAAAILFEERTIEGYTSDKPIVGIDYIIEDDLESDVIKAFIPIIAKAYPNGAYIYDAICKDNIDINYEYSIVYQYRTSDWRANYQDSKYIYYFLMV